ncbi:MAG: Npt1/Npt2 family nucleotide transporter [Acidobacteriota bacterium]
MQSLIRWTQYLGIRKGEHGRFAWLFAHSLFNGICIAFLFSSAYALFLERYDVEDLPWAYIATALVGYAVVAVFSRLERELPFKKLLLYQLYFVLVFILTFWAAARLGSANWPVFLMFVALAPLLTLLELEYWGIAVRLFDLRQGKRLFNLVSTGGVLSSIAGFFLVPVMAKTRLIREFEDLLLFAAFGVALSIMAAGEIARRFHDELEIRSADDKKRDSGSLRQLTRDRYFLLMALLVVVLILTFFLIDLSFLAQVEQQFTSGVALAAFMGQFYGVVKFLELLFKTFLSGRLVSQFGVRFGLVSLPVALLIAITLAIASHPLAIGVELFFLTVAVTKLIWLVLRKAIFDGAFKVLYQPLQGEEKFVFQARLEGTVSPAVTLGVGVLLLLNSRGGFEAIRLLYLALPLLAVWLVAVAMLHREYRRRLLQVLQREAGQKTVESPVGEIRRRLLEATPDEFDYVLDVLEKVDSTVVAETLVEVVEQVPELRVPALCRIERSLDFDAVAAVEPCLSDEDPAVRAAATETMGALRDVVTLAGGTNRIAALIESRQPADRQLAALALGWSAAGNPGDLTGLLWDRDPSVRRAALRAAGRLRDPRFWSRIIAHLSEPRFAADATNALIAIGQPVVGELEGLFGKVGQDPGVRTRILDVFDHVGGSQAVDLLTDKLRFPDKEVRRRVRVTLSHRRYKPDSDAVPALKDEVEKQVKTMAWNLGAILDLGEGPDTVDVREALESENRQNRADLFRLLSLLFDSRAMALVRDNLELGNQESTVYALEILDVVVSRDIKPMLFPVVEDLPPAKAVRRLDPYFQRQRMKRRDRLEAIAFRHFDEMSSWTRACALRAIAELSSSTVERVLVANIFHPIGMLQEVAAGSILSVDAGAYGQYLERLPRRQRERVERVIQPGGEAPEAWESRSMFGRVAKLREAPAFAALPWESLMKIAAEVEEVEVPTGERFPSADEPAGTLFLVVEGRLGFYGEAGGIGTVPTRSLVAFAREAIPSRVLEAARLFRFGGNQVYELMAMHVELVEAVVAAASPPSVQEVVSLSRSFESAISFVPSN